jgi:two-component system phosphate regulon sensor histidine kinase PhoR
MEKKSTKIIFGLIIISFIGLTYLQFFWVSKALKVQERLFSERVHEILYQVAGDLERSEFADFIDVNYNGNEAEIRVEIKTPDMDTIISKFSEEVDSLKKMIEEESYHITQDSNFFSPIPKMKKRKRRFFRGKNRKLRRQSPKFFELYDRNLDKVIILEKLLKDIKRPKAIRERVDIARTDSLIKTYLAEKGIDTKYELEFLGRKKIRKNMSKMNDAVYHTRLFPNDLIFRNNFLQIYFPDKKSFIFGKLSVSGILSLSIFFIFLLFSGFVYFVRVVFRQKKLSELKNDFINNMTHELKTPIATIGLAVEGIKKKQLDEKILRYSDVISEENKRLSSQVSKILQISILEKENFTFSEVNIHHLIKSVSDEFLIRVEEREGQFIFNFFAENAIVEIDEEHIKHVFRNLFDNAIKYSSEKVKVTIETYIEKNNFVIRVKDNGIGLSRDEQKMIFEKFYRVPTGNVHNVKGFGLGLSYVKTIIQSHNGEIFVESKKGVGTEFILLFPAKR